jgi:hypothetical protein
MDDSRHEGKRTVCYILVENFVLKRPLGHQRRIVLKKFLRKWCFKV